MSEISKEFEKAFTDNCASWKMDDERAAALWAALWAMERCANISETCENEEHAAKEIRKMVADLRGGIE